MPHAFLAGVDVGGTKVAVAVVDAHGQVQSRLTAPTDLGSPEQTLAGIGRAVRDAVTQAGATFDQVSAVGVGVPGRVDAATGVVALATNLNWREFPLGERLSGELGVPCFLENDVRAATLGLQRYTHYSAVQDMAYLSIGTGIAAGLILRGRLYKGAHGMAGEIGHACLDAHGPRCACGMPGCLEIVAAGPAIARQAQQAIDAGVETSLLTHRSLTAEDVYRAAESGDAVARSIAERVGCHLAQAIYNLVMAYDVEHVVLGGGVARAGDVFLQPIRRELDRWRDASALAHEMLPPDLIHLLPPGFDAGTWGAVALAELGLQHGA